VVVLVPLLAASLAAPQEAKPLEFAADVRMIRLDVSVVDRRGRPVAGLGASDFSVREDGRPVEITLFQAVDDRAGDIPHEGAPADGVGFVVTPEASPASPRRRILLLVDAVAMSPGQLIRASESAARYLRDGTSAGDWVRLVNLSTGQGWDGAIPEDRARLQQAALRLWRGGSAWDGKGELPGMIENRRHVQPPGAPSEAQTTGQFLSVFAQSAGLLGMLESLLVQLHGIEGRKALVLLSPGFPQLQDLDRRIQRVASLARESATALYFVDAAGLDGLLPEGRGEKLVPAFEAAWNRSGGAQDLAEATGGFTSRFTNDLTSALELVGEEMRTYYVVGYVPPRPADARFRSVKVEVKAKGVTARTKKGYLPLP
jgi:VWFA-related protein